MAYNSIEGRRDTVCGASES